MMPSLVRPLTVDFGQQGCNLRNCNSIERKKKAFSLLLVQLIFSDVCHTEVYIYPTKLRRVGSTSGQIW